jgi:hypothetical protein
LRYLGCVALLVVAGIACKHGDDCQVCDQLACLPIRENKQETKPTYTVKQEILCQSANPCVRLKRILLQEEHGLEHGGRPFMVNRLVKKLETREVCRTEYKPVVVAPGCSPAEEELLPPPREAKDQSP